MGKSASMREWIRVSGHVRRGMKSDWSNRHGAESKGGHDRPLRPKIMGWRVWYKLAQSKQG